ncbi:MAG: hypothetical protein P4L22_07170 [Candidatus Babeliales bacterium]|nr:hypothetical protein [Candidatus Babeliales bacterium]
MKNLIIALLISLSISASEKKLPKGVPHTNPPCCYNKADGQVCSNSDECRGSCKKETLLSDKGICINQAKYCDLSKCQFSKNEQPKCCLQKSDGRICNNSDECRGSCQREKRTKSNSMSSYDPSKVCVNQEKYCDIKRCK